MLPVEVPAFGSLHQQAVGLIALSCDIGVQPLVTELRDQHAFRSSNPAMLYGSHVIALVKVGRGGMRCERVQTKVIELLLINGERSSRRLLRIDDPVELGE